MTSTQFEKLCTLWMWLPMGQYKSIQPRKPCAKSSVNNIWEKTSSSPFVIGVHYDRVFTLLLFFIRFFLRRSVSSGWIFLSVKQDSLSSPVFPTLNKSVALHTSWSIWWLSWNVIFFDCWLFKSKLDTQSILCLDECVRVCIANNTHHAREMQLLQSQCTQTFATIERLNFQLVFPQGVRPTAAITTCKWDLFDFFKDLFGHFICSHVQHHSSLDMFVYFVNCQEPNKTLEQQHNAAPMIMIKCCTHFQLHVSLTW